MIMHPSKNRSTPVDISSKFGLMNFAMHVLIPVFHFNTLLVLPMRRNQGKALAPTLLYTSLCWESFNVGPDLADFKSENYTYVRM